MRLTIIIIMLTLIQVSAASFAQKVTYIKDGTSLKELFKQIRKQTGYNVFYSDKKIDDRKKINVNFKASPLEVVLETCAAQHSMEYTIDDKNIYFKPKSPSFIDKVVDFFSVIDVRGKVLDENGEPLQGATVRVKESTVGAMTDKDGEFFLKGVSEDAILTIMYLGYKTLELKAGGNMGVIKMELATSELEEVTVSTGYWTTTKKLSTGNISKVTGKDIENQPVTSPLMALQGRVAGLEITPSTGAPGSAPKIRIRGYNSLRIQGKAGSSSDGNLPLYVIDGVPMNSTPIQSIVDGNSMSRGGYDPLSTINPNNIASIEVLKDGDATAIYGSRGANGVILITTKSIIKNTGQTNFEMNIYQGVGQISHRMELLNTKQYVTMRTEALENANTTSGAAAALDLIGWDTTRYTNWQDVLMGGASNITEIQGAISSGNEKTGFRINGGYHRETLLFPGNFGYQRGSGGISLNHKSNDGRFTASVISNYGIDLNNLFSGDFITAALTLPPNAPRLYEASGDLNWEIIEFEGRRFSSWLNPMSYTKVTQKAVTSNLVANTILGYKVSPEITLSMSAGLTDLRNNENSKTPSISFSPTDESFPSASFVDTKRSSWIMEPKLSFSKQWEKHEVDAIAGSTWQRSLIQNNSYLGSDYSSDALLGSLKGAGKITVFNEEFAEYKYLSFYGRMGYRFDQKYLLNLTMRRDGSSRFGTENRFANFWSAGAGWIFTAEPFLKNINHILNFGKIRASYGVTGSDNLGDYKYYDLYTISGQQYQGVIGSNPAFLFNPEFAWETTRKFELGIELSLFDNRFATEVSWFSNESSNQLVDYTLPATAGFPSVLQNFDALVSNYGLEVLLRTEAVRRTDLQWSISLNASLPRNKLVKYDGLEDSPYVNFYKVGLPVNVQWLYQWRGVNPQTGLYEFIDRNNDGLINQSDKVLDKSVGRNFYGGITNTVRFKSFELSFLFQFAKAKVLAAYFTTPGLLSNQPIQVLGRWQREGDVTNVQKFSTYGAITSPLTSYFNMIESDHSIVDASFIRLKTGSINWQLPTKWIESLRLQQLKVFLQGQNLLTLTKSISLDPETGNSFPPLRMFTLGIQLKF